MLPNPHSGKEVAIPVSSRYGGIEGLRHDQDKQKEGRLIIQTMIRKGFVTSKGRSQHTGIGVWGGAICEVHNTRGHSRGFGRGAQGDGLRSAGGE